MKLTLLGFLASQYLNVPYLWNGKNVLGFDCSGFVTKALNDVGYTLPIMTSQDIFRWMIKNRDHQSMEPCADCVLFFGKSTEDISHVSLAIDEIWMIEAGGAGSDSLNMTPAQLAAKDARVRYRKISNRRDLVASIKLSYEDR